MITSRFSLVATVLFVATLPVAQAAHTRHSEVPTDPRKALRELEMSAKHAETDADQFRMSISHNNLSPESHLFELDALKADVNKMGKELATLESERASLSSWEQQAIDKVTPLLKAEATSTADAIRFFNDNRNYLWAPDYRSDADGIWHDSQQIANTLNGYLKYSEARDQAQHLKTNLNIGTE